MSKFEPKFRLICQNTNQAEIAVTPVVTERGDEISLFISKEQLMERKCGTLRIESDLTAVSDSTGGYLFYPTNFHFGVVKTDIRRRKDAEFVSDIAAMPVCGICENENAVMVLVQSMDSDVRFRIGVKAGVFYVTPEFVLDGDDPDEDFLIVYKKMPGATYSDMAREYRKYQIEVKGCVPLKERVKVREELKHAADCLELRVRMGWKPQPTPVRRQTVENEPPMKVACDIPTLHKIVDKMKEKGVEGAEICLVGWAEGGHDGRFPQHYPCDARFGTDKELREFIKKAQDYGYMVTCHSNSKGAYEIANNWDEKLLLMHIGEDGKQKPWLREDYAESGLQGGDPWHVCPKPAYEHYALNDFPVIRSYGFCGLHYVDELTACVPLKCYAKEHPVSRKQTIEYYRKIAQLSTALFGGCQSEAWFDFLNADMDYVLYTSVVSEISGADHEKAPLIDEIIPFFSLVYHGIVMSNASSATVNYPIKTAAEHLKFIEFGGRPTLYINSKFCGRDWMGVEDLFCDSDEAIEKTVDVIKFACDEYQPLKHLQYEFMENHEKIGDGVYRVTYSDGSVITVDYHAKTYEVSR